MVFEWLILFFSKKSVTGICAHVSNSGHYMYFFDIWPEFDAGAHIPVPFGVLKKNSSFWQSFPCILGPNCVPTYNLTL
jgi:hypothetical protein